MVRQRRFARYAARQGFDDPLDETPLDGGNPEGWHGGAVEQTGGGVLNRIWTTHPAVGTVHGERPGGECEYVVVYGREPGVALNRRRWVRDAFSSGEGAYRFDTMLEAPDVPENTDAAKAEIAAELMRAFDRTADGEH